MTGPTCIANIGPRGRRRRRFLGWVALGVGLVLAGLLFTRDAPRMWRLALVLPLWAAALGLLQARERT